MLISQLLGNEISGHGRDGHLGRKDERVAPLHHLAVGDLGVLGAEGRVADEHLEHDDAQRPPVARAAVAALHEHFGRDVVGRADGRVGQLASLLLPRLGASLRVGRVGYINHNKNKSNALFEIRGNGYTYTCPMSWCLCWDW